MDRAGRLFYSDMVPAQFPVVVKALLVHRAKWGEKGPVLQELYGPNGQGQDVAKKDNISRLLGYGPSAVDEAWECSTNRATLVGFGEITNPSLANQYRIPLPPSLERVTEPRTVTVTVAWMAPINPRSRNYRTVKLNARPVSPMESAFGVEEQNTNLPMHPPAAALYFTYVMRVTVSFSFTTVIFPLKFGVRRRISTNRFDMASRSPSRLVKRYQFMSR